MPSLQLWAGVECTVNRVGDVYFDQLASSGHAARHDDLDRFARLGLTTLRYPLLWERTQPDPHGDIDWSWGDARLGYLRALRLPPILGLVHHGSGPRHTSLVEPSFAEGLARYARAVAGRYPWVESYTPVNEPLTTARFSGLYGHWYPHGRDGRTFARALLNQCRAVVLAMRAVREVNAAARLVQTDDLGKCFSTPALAYQADFENERRWLTWDLLAGRVDRHHPMWGYLRWVGAEEAALAWFLDNPCPPDVMGINYYVTSERFLDERLGRYPADTHGGNGRHRYADVEAVRVRPEGLAGPGRLLAEAWQRYRRPLAFTEVHLGCTREEQMRWLLEVWDAAQEQRRSGVAVRAVTAWSLLGSYDWHCLATRCEGRYEPGVFDLRGPEPRPTALAGVVRDLAAGRQPTHPVLATPGWWHRPERLLIHEPGATVRFSGEPKATAPPAPAPHRTASVGAWISKAAERGQCSPHPPRGVDAGPRPLLITGATGTLGRAFGRICRLRGLAHHLLRRADMDIADPASVARALARFRPWAVVNAAGYVRVDDAEGDPARCFRENTEGPAVLAAACARQGVALLTFSSDLVFDGRQGSPYRERDAVAPLNVYGRSKADAERQVLESLPEALVVRTSAFFGPWDEYNFVVAALRRLAAGRPFAAADDAVVSPTYVPDLVHACLDLLIDGEHGVWHLANQGAVTWLELARQAADRARLDVQVLEGRPTAALGLAAPRPRYSALASARGTLLPALDDALARYVAQSEVPWTETPPRPCRPVPRLRRNGTRPGPGGVPATAGRANSDQGGGGS